MSRFTTETKRKPCLNQVLVVLFTNIDSLVCLAASNNVGSKMFNKNAILSTSVMNIHYEGDERRNLRD